MMPETSETTEMSATPQQQPVNPSDDHPLRHKFLATIHWLLLIAIYSFFGVKAFLTFLPLSPRPAPDFLLYHLPRALALFGKTTYTPSLDQLRKFAGYPPLPEFIQGLLVVTTGRMSTANGVGFVGMTIAVLTLFFLFRNRKVTRWFLTFCLALPLLLLHLQVGYSDLFTATMVFVGFLGFFALQRGERPMAGAMVMFLGLTAAMLSKATAWPIVGVLALFSWYWLYVQAKAQKLSRFFATAVGLGLLVSIGIWPIRNLLMFQSPVYPILIAPQYLFVQVERFPPPIRFLISIFELNRLYAWNEPFGYFVFGPQHDSEHFRLGGWFIGTVIFMCIALILEWRKAPKMLRNELLPIILGMIGFSFLRDSFDLRYSFFFPLIFLFVVSMHLPLLGRRTQFFLKLGFLSCAAYILVVVMSSTWMFDFSTPAELAPPEAMIFWDNASHRPPGTHFLISPKAQRAAIYWSGPTFNEYHVRLVPTCEILQIRFMPAEDCLD